MREFSACLVLVLFVAILVGASGNPVGDESIATLEAAEQPLSLIDVEAQQGHENEGDRLTRQYGGFGGRGGWGGVGRFGSRGGYGGFGRRGGYWG